MSVTKVSSDDNIVPAINPDGVSAVTPPVTIPPEEEVIKLYYPALSEQMQRIRDSVVRILNGYLTISFAMLGLTITNVHNLSDKRRLLLSVSLILVSLLFSNIIRTMNRQFSRYATVISRINQYHGTYTKGRFGLKSDTHLYPPEWKDFGSSNWREPLFQNAYFVVASICLLGLLVIWVIS
jgi:hypothetical protein